MKSFFVLLLSLLLVLAVATLAGAAEGSVLHEAQGQVPRFPNLYVIGWTMVNFLVLLALLYKFAFNPINAMLDNRSKTIANSMQYAEDIRTEVDTMRKEAQASLNDARKESQDIVNRALKTAEDMKQDLLTQANVDVNALKARAEREIVSATESAKQELREAAANLAILAAEKVLNHSITPADHQAMIQQFIDESGDRIC
jgi:F-type H+-transporting ATPase subunit b